MLPSRYRTPFLIMIVFALTLSYLPSPASSFPIIAFQGRSYHASNSSYIDNQLAFDVSFTFVLLIVFLMTYVWIVCRLTIDRIISGVNRLLGVSISIAEEVVDQLLYLRLDTIIRPLITARVDANDFRRDFTRPMGESANPISTTARSPPQGQRSPRVIPPGYGIRRVDISDRGAPPLRSTPV